MAYDGTLKFDTSLDTSGFQSGASGLGDIARNALSVFTGNLMTEAINRVGELGQVALQSGIEFEASMAKVKTLFSGTGEEFAQLSDEILRLSSNSGLAASGLAEAAYSAESASVPAEQLGVMLEESSKLAAAGFTDVDTALSATAKTMNAYGMTGEESIGRVQKVLMQTQNLGITTVGELGASLAQVTPTASAFGVSFEQVGASLAVMTAQGTSTAQATTQLNSLIAELGKSGTTASKNLQRAAEGTKYAGMSFTEMMDAGADLGTILEMLSAQADKDNVSMVDMFSSIEAGKAALSIFNEEGETFRADLEQMSTSADVVGDAYATVSDTLEFKTQQMKTSFQNLATVAQQTVAQDMKDAMDIGVDAVQRMQTALQEGGFAGLAQEALKIGSEMTRRLADGIMKGIPKVTEAVVGIMKNITSGIQSKLPDLIPVAMEALVSFSETIRSNVGELVDAGLEMVMALADSLIQNIPVFVKTVPTIVTNIAGLINDNAPKILSCGVQLIGKLVGGIISALPVIAQNIPQIIKAIVSVLMAFNWLDLGGKIITFIKNGIQNLATTVPQALKDIGNTAIEWFSAIDWATLGSDIIDLIVMGVESLFTAIPNMLQSIGASGIEFIKGIDWIGAGTFLVEGIISGVEGMASAAGDAILGVGRSILNGFKSFFGISSPSKVMEDQGEYLVEGVINSLAATPEAIASCLSEALNSVTDWGADMAAKAKEAAASTVNMVKSGLSSLAAGVQTHLTNALSKVRAWGSKLASSGRSAAQTCVNAVKGAFGGLASNLKSVGENIASGLANGIRNGISWVTNAARDLANKAVSTAKSVLGINSPSRVFEREVGHFIPPGIGRGISRAMPAMEKATVQELRGMAERMRNAVDEEMAATKGSIRIRSGFNDPDIPDDNRRGNVYQTININQPVKTPSETARAIRLEQQYGLAGE